MAHTRVLISVWLVLSAALTGCQDAVYANYEYRDLDSGEDHGSGVCIPIGGWRPQADGSGGGGDVEGDIRYDFNVADDTLILDISSQERMLEHREYSEKRLRTGKRDQFTVETLAGRSYEINVWGSDDCELEGL